MPYNNLTSRTDVQALIAEQVNNTAMMANLTNESAALKMFTRVTMPTNQTRMPVLSALPTAYFVNGDTGLKQTTEANWANKYLNAEELAAIVPIPEAVLMDTTYDLDAAIRPLLEQAIGRALDAAVFFGTNIPASWPAYIVSGATTASNTVTRGANNAANGGIAADLSDVFGLVEADGYEVDGIIAKTTIRSLLRDARDANGVRHAEVSTNEAWGVPVVYPMRGQWPAGSGLVEAIVGDFTQGILAVRQDFTYKLITEGVITDTNGDIIYNLPQQDMVALRVVFRVAFQVANPINYDQATEASRYPFGLLLTT